MPLAVSCFCLVSGTEPHHPQAKNAIRHLATRSLSLVTSILILPSPPDSTTGTTLFHSRFQPTHHHINPKLFLPRGSRKMASPSASTTKKDDKPAATAEPKPEDQQPPAQKSAAALEEDDEFEDFPIDSTCVLAALPPFPVN